MIAAYVWACAKSTKGRSHELYVCMPCKRRTFRMLWLVVYVWMPLHIAKWIIDKEELLLILVGTLERNCKMCDTSDIWCYYRQWE